MFVIFSNVIFFLTEIFFKYCHLLCTKAFTSQEILICRRYHVFVGNYFLPFPLSSCSWLPTYQLPFKNPYLPYLYTLLKHIAVSLLFWLSDEKGYKGSFYITRLILCSSLTL